MTVTCLMVLLVVLGTCFLRKYVFDAYEGVRCRNYQCWASLQWRIPRRNHLMGDWLFHFLGSFQGGQYKFLCHFYDICYLLIAFVAYGEPTPGNYHMHDVVRPSGAFWGSSWQKHNKTRYSPLVGFLLPYTFLVSNRSLRFFWGLLLWMLSIGRARHPGPGTSSYPPGFCIEFLTVGGWLSRGDLALESSAHFLAIAEHRLVPARARAVTTQLRQARRSSVWAPSCQDVTPGGHAGVGVISLHGAPLSLPTLLDPSFKEFFRVGRAMRVILPLGDGGVVHLFVIYGYQGAENDPEKLQLTDHLFTAVLAEARMCCCGQPVILAGDFNADPIVIPSLAKGISDGHWIDLERAFPFGKGVPPASTCQFQLDEDKGSRRDFLLACPIALAAATACYVSPDRWFTPHFSVSAEFSLSAWDATVERARTHSPLWPACWLQVPDRSRSSGSPEVRDIWDVYIREVGFVPLAVREQLFRLCNSPDVDSSWLLWSREAEASLARAYLSAGGPSLSGPSSYVGRGSLSLYTL